MIRKNQSCSATAIIVAAGSSSRMKNNLNKMFILLDDIPILAHTLLKFENSNRVNRIIIVTKSDSIVTVGDIVREFNISKVSDIITGGKTRQESVMCGLKYTDDNNEIILVHDGARPFVSTQNISEAISAAETFGAAALGVSVKDTVKVVDDNNIVNETPDRNHLRLIQTPQVFKSDIIKAAYAKAEEDGFEGTDDCSVVEHSNIPVKIIEGEYTNIKITTADDLCLAEAIYKNSTY